MSLKISTDDGAGEMEIYTVPKSDIVYLTSISTEFREIVDRSTNIYYFKGVKLNISNEENYELILRIISEYNTMVDTSNNITLTTSDIEGLKAKKNLDYSFSSVVDKSKMIEAIKKIPVDPKYKGIAKKLFKKAISTIPIIPTDLLFAESASTNHSDLMTFSNFYLTREERSRFLLEYFYKRFLGFHSFIGKGTYDLFKSIRITELLEEFNIIYLSGDELISKIDSLERKIKYLSNLNYMDYKEKYLKYKNKYLSLKESIGGSALSLARRRQKRMNKKFNERGKNLNYGIGIENEFAYIYGEPEVISGREFIGRITDSSGNINKSFSNSFKDLSFADSQKLLNQIKDLPKVRIIEVVNLNLNWGPTGLKYVSAISGEHLPTEMIKDKDFKRKLIEGHQKFHNKTNTELSLSEKSGIFTTDTKSFLDSLVNFTPGEETAYTDFMVEIATRRHESPSLNEIIEEIEWKRKFALETLKRYLTILDKDDPIKDYYNNLSKLKVYNNEPYDFIKYKNYSGEGPEYLYIKDYLASLHFNITLPRSVPSSTDLTTVEKTKHLVIIKLLQLFSPVLISTFGQPDYSFGRIDGTTNGSLRILHSKTIGINSSDTREEISSGNREAEFNLTDKRYELYMNESENLKDSFNYGLLKKKIVPNDKGMYKVGLDFRRSKSCLGFEYRLMDYCGIDGIKAIIKFIFLLTNLLDYSGINQSKCIALNNEIINQQIFDVFKTEEQSLSSKYRELVRDCSGLWSDETNPKEYFRDIYLQLVSKMDSSSFYYILKTQLNVDRLDF